MEFDEEDSGPPPRAPEKPFSLLKRAFLNEICAPELLPYQDSTVDTLVSLVQKQRERIKQLPVSDGPIAELYQIDVNRVNYLVQAYLRVRLTKIQKYVMYLLQDGNPMIARLSSAELAFAKNYRQLFERHLSDSLLSFLPENLRRLDEKRPEFSMVPEPQLSTYVIFRVLADIGEFELKPGMNVQLLRNDVYAVNYQLIRSLLLDGKVELL